jgi:murein DD-endopeptidase MepM/ murein hydrolase activator NlpD
MDRFWRIVRNRLTLLSGAGGVLGLGALVMAQSIQATPDGGMLEPLLAASAEETRVDVLRSGRTFGGMLQQTALSVTDQQGVLLAFREHANPARLRAGLEISLRYVRGTEYLRSVDVAVSSDELVRLERRSSGWSSSVVRTPVWVDTLAVGGVIESDLWTAVVMNPQLDQMPRQDRAQVIHLLDRVFQWQLDFSRQIQQGDTYRLVFKREVRPDGSMRSGRILAAELVNSGLPLYAVWFDLHGDQVGGYYDLDGESLQRAFIRAPLEFRRITSRFNQNRYHPILKVPRPHIGVDYAAASGTPVMATADGVVSQRGFNGGYGNSVEVTHGNGFLTRYAHLNGFVSGIRQGMRVSQGQIIGYVGMTGLATGPHLHYEMHQSGRAVDPSSIDIPAGDPIPAEVRGRWAGELDARLVVLGRTPGGPVIRMAQVDTEAPEAAVVSPR